MKHTTEQHSNLWQSLITLLGLVFATKCVRSAVLYLCSFAPQGDLSRFFQLCLVQLVPVAVVLLFVKYGEQRSIRSMRIAAKGGIKSYLQGTAIALLLIAVITALSFLLGEIDYRGFSNTFSIAPFGAALLLSMINIREEVVFRGWFLTSAYSRSHLVHAILGGSILFGWMHCWNSHVTMLSLVNLVLFSIFLSELFLIGKSFWLVAAFHSIWNFAQGKVLGLPISGSPSKLSLLAFEARPESQTAGFGLEGNWITSVVLCVVIALATRTVVRMYQKELPDAVVKEPNEC